MAGLITLSFSALRKTLSIVFGSAYALVFQSVLCLTTTSYGPLGGTTLASYRIIHDAIANPIARFSGTFVPQLTASFGFIRTSLKLGQAITFSGTSNSGTSASTATLERGGQTLSDSVVTAIGAKVKAPEGRDEDYELHYDGSGPRVVIYVRVSSTGQQKKGLSLGLQEEEMLGWVQKFRPSHVYVMKDGGKSGIDFTKRKMGKISRLKAEGKIDEVWVRSVDRLGRDCFELVFFFIKFLGDGGIIRTQKDSYKKDPADLQRFCNEAISAHTSNKEREDAALASKRKSFRGKKWNKPIPFGYRRIGSDGREPEDRWIEKNPAESAVVIDVFGIFRRHQDYGMVRRGIWEKYKIHLSRDRIRGILRNPVYVGKPSLSGEVVRDDSLAFVSETEFLEVQLVVAEIESKKERKSDWVFQQIAYNDVWSLRQLLDTIQEHYVGCGAPINSNGIDRKSDPPQISFICRKRVHQWRFPLRQLKVESPLLPYDNTDPPIHPYREQNVALISPGNPATEGGQWLSALSTSESLSDSPYIARPSEKEKSNDEKDVGQVNPTGTELIIETKPAQDQLKDDEARLRFGQFATEKSTLVVPELSKSEINNWDDFLKHLEKLELQQLPQDQKTHQEEKKKLLSWVEKKGTYIPHGCRSSPALQFFKARILRCFGYVAEVTEDHVK